MSHTPEVGHGIGLRSKHWNRILEELPKVDWFEIISENYMDAQGKALRVLEKVREHYPVGCHGVSMSIGSTDPLNPLYLEQLKNLVTRVEPIFISDHLCWTGVHQSTSHDLLPLPFTRETLYHVASRIDFVQNYLRRTILIENVSSYVSFSSSEMTEWEFLAELHRISGCQILLDINNVFVNSFNHRFNPQDFIEHLPPQSVGQFHLAGHTHKGDYILDTHSAPVIDAVWSLYQRAVKKFGKIPSLIEWDEKIPDLDELLKEREKAIEVEQNAFA